MELGTFARCSSWCLSAKYKKIVDLVIHRNEYFIPGESVPGQWSWLRTIDHTLRELGLRRVMKARAANPSGQMRSFKAPAKPNFDAVEYFDTIDWALGPISEHPVIEVMLDPELRDLITTEVTPASLTSPATQKLWKDTWSWWPRLRKLIVDRNREMAKSVHASFLENWCRSSNQNVTSLTSPCDYCDVQIARYDNWSIYCINRVLKWIPHLDAYLPMLF